MTIYNITAEQTNGISYSEPILLNTINNIANGIANFKEGKENKDYTKTLEKLIIILDAYNIENPDTKCHEMTLENNPIPSNLFKMFKPFEIIGAMHNLLLSASQDTINSAEQAAKNLSENLQCQDYISKAYNHLFHISL